MVEPIPFPVLPDGFHIRAISGDTEPDGELAAFCVCLIDPDSGGKEGQTDPIGTHPDYRQKDMAHSLLLEGLRRLKL